MDGDGFAGGAALECVAVRMAPSRLAVYRAVLAATERGAREVVGKLTLPGMTDRQVRDRLQRCRDLGLIEAGEIAPGKKAGGLRMRVLKRLPGVEPLADGEWTLSAPVRKPASLATGVWEWDDEDRRSAALEKMNASFARLISRAGSFEDSAAAARAEVLHRRPPPVMTSGCSSATSWQADAA